jgi:hypothetical protein
MRMPLLEMLSQKLQAAEARKKDYAYRAVLLVLTANMFRDNLNQ